MTLDFEILSNATKEYVDITGAKNYDDFRLIDSFTNIIYKEKDKFTNFKYTKKYSLKEIDKIVSNFLNYLNPYYADYYEIRKSDGSIIFDENRSAYNKGAYSLYDDIYNQRIIYIPIRHTIEDAYAIIHELMHDINVDEKQKSITRMFYTEALSILAEFLFKDYLIDNNIKDAEIPINFTLYCAKSKAITVNFNINLILKYLEDNYIDAGKIISVIENYPEAYAKDLCETISEIVLREELTLDFEEPYMIGTLIATYMYDRIKQNKYNILELFELNIELKNYEFEQVLDYLDLDYYSVSDEVDDLTYESYKKLEKCYKKYLKGN